MKKRIKQDFTEVMTKRTDEELIKIVTVQRDDYQPEAVEIAEKELESRKIDTTRIESVKQELTEKETQQKEFDSSIVSSWTRLIHFIVDLIAYSFFAFMLILFLKLFFISTDHEALILISYGLFFISFFFYFVFMEYKYQKTIGKFLTKTKVIMKNGKRPELHEIFIRTACRLIPLDRISFLFTRNGFHDRLSDTIVIKEDKTNANNVYKKQTE